MPAVRSLTAQLFTFGPHAGAHRVAARAAVTVAVALVTLWALDRTEWSIYAAFGAFTSLYGRHDVHRGRLQMQVSVGLVLVASVVAGTAVGLADQRAWLVVPTAALLAGVGAALSDLQGWHPPGPLFPVFAFTACASVPSQPGDLPVALLVSAATAGLALLIGGVGGYGRAWRDPSLRTRPRPATVEAVQTRHVLRAVLGVLVAGSVATAAGIGHPYWAMVSAVVPLAAPNLEAGLHRGVQRVLGTAAGLVLAGVLLELDLPHLGLVAVVVVLQAAAELLIGRNYAVALVAVTPLALLMVDLMASVPTRTLLLDRGVETVIGVLVGVGVAWLTRRRD